MKVFMNPSASMVDERTGIGQVVINLESRLKKSGIQFVENENEADLVATHVLKGSLKSVDILHCHGLYFDDVPHIPYDSWHYRINREIAQTAREALEVIVPSEWVAEPYKRDMRLVPNVIPHGIDTSLWKREESLGYILWNKNRASDVCDPVYAFYLAGTGLDVVSTFAPKDMKSCPKELRVIGAQSHKDMKNTIQHAHIYLATTLETFGIGTLEALASGVPVLGFNWGATPDIVTHLVTGYLATPGDVNDLLKGEEYIRDHWKEMSEACLQRAKDFSWDEVARRYYDVYLQAHNKKRNENHAVSIVIPNYNYGHYIKEAIDSVLSQNELPEEIIVVDDGSTDNSANILNSYGDKIKTFYRKNEGVSSSRNFGISQAKGEFIVCLDADDKIGESFVKTLKGALIKNRALGIAYTGLALIHDNNPTESPQLGWPPEFNWEGQSIAHVPPSNCIPSACMFRKEMWRRAGGFRQVYAPGEDAEFWTRGLSVGFDAKRVTVECLFKYRVHTGSASRTKKYVPTDAWSPWMRDRDFPFGAPVSSVTNVHVRSYMTPNVSVIIPLCREHIPHAWSAIESVVGQTDRQWELIIVADGVPEEEVSEIKTVYPFIKWFFVSPQKGTGHARNIGIENAKAPYVFFLDADDFIAPTTLERLTKHHKNSPGRYVYTDWVEVADTMKEHAVKDYAQNLWFEPSPYGEDWLNGIHGVSVLMLTSQAKEIKFDEKLPAWEDWDFFVRCAIKGYCGIRFPEPLLYYRVNSGVRTKRAFSDNAVLAKSLRGRYNKYSERKVEMGGCCGGNAVNLTKDGSASSQDGDVVRLEYIGENQGAISFNVSGKTYRGGANPLNRYIDARQDHVQFLLSTGKWKVVASENASIQRPDPEKIQAPQLGEAKDETTETEMAEVMKIDEEGADKNLGLIHKVGRKKRK